MRAIHQPKKQSISQSSAHSKPACKPLNNRATNQARMHQPFKKKQARNRTSNHPIKQNNNNDQASNTWTYTSNKQTCKHANNQLINGPTQPINRAINHTTNHAIKRPNNQSIGQPSKRLTNQTNKQSINRSNNQRTNQTTGQPPQKDKSINQSIRQSNPKPIQQKHTNNQPNN